MALTIKPLNKQGELMIVDDEFGKIGAGRAHASKEPGYVTLTLRFSDPHFDLKQNRIRVNEFLVIRVPINWLEELDAGA
jgi:hypothetical protein